LKHDEHGKAWLLPPIICGDLNNPSHRPDATSMLFRYMSRHGAYVLHPDNTHTFPSPWPRRALDFVFLPPRCINIQSEVIRAFVSDHRPVVVEFTVSNS
ncbi:MAG TPA: endonuclease/exonuclease/phosphatase family protein, partial [Opitutaceae bacterium]|nr:endonuclease/exonuclease/phosphatase family protein [Opitutaceae bacterium]